jgi:uncharacterized protein YeaO (DUF488 family)
MFTSYFAKSANKFYAVAITRRTPFWYSGREYKALAPSLELLKKYKADGDKAYFTEQYQRKVLDQLDPFEVYKELGETAVLLCYEKSSDFCHRHLAARWLEKHIEIEIKEIE